MIYQSVLLQKVNLLESLADKGYTFPKDLTHVMNFVHSKYKQTKENLIFKITIEITSGARFSILLDKYTSLNNRWYLNITVHRKARKFWILEMARISGS